MIIEISAKNLCESLPAKLDIKDVDTFVYSEYITEPFCIYVIGKREPLVIPELNDILLYDKNRKKVAELKDYKNELAIDYPLKIGKDGKVIVFGGNIIFIDVEKYPNSIEEYYSLDAIIYIKNREFIKGNLDILHKYSVDIK